MTFLIDTLQRLYAMRDNAADDGDDERMAAMQAAINALMPEARKEV